MINELEPCGRIRDWKNTKTIEGESTPTTIFTPPYEGWSPCIISENKNATRNSKPTMTEEPNIEPTFKQELNNPSVRDRVYPEGRELTEQFYADLVLQLNAAQKTAVYFEKEAATWMGEAWRLSNERARLAENVIPTLQATIDRLEKPGFWRRFWNAFNRKGFATGGD